MDITVNRDTVSALDSVGEDHAAHSVAKELDRFNDQIVHVKVHVSEETGHTEGEHAKRCRIEVMLEHNQSLAVTTYGQSEALAVQSAIEKIKMNIHTKLGQLFNF